MMVSQFVRMTLLLESFVERGIELRCRDRVG